MSAEDERRAAMARVAAELRDLAQYLRSEGTRLGEADADTSRLDQVLAELEPILVRFHDAEIAGAVAQVLDRHGPGPWPDADLAALARVDPTELRRIRDQITAHRSDQSG